MTMDFQPVCFALICTQLEVDNNSIFSQVIGHIKLYLHYEKRTNLFFWTIQQQNTRRQQSYEVVVHPH